MSDLKDLNEFYKFYDTPKVEKVIVGFSGIDPIPKGFTPDMGSLSGGGSGSETPSGTSTEITNHEQLDGLFGGDDDGHYHFKHDEYEELQEVLQIRREEKENEETFYRLTEDQHNKLIHIIEALYPDPDSDTPVLINGDTLDIGGETLNSLIDTRIQEYMRNIDGGEVNP